MLPDETLPSLAAVLMVFRRCFTAPTYRTFTGLVVGLIAQTRRRTVCGMLLGAGLQRCWHHARAHRFFSTARWCADQVGLSLADLIVTRLLVADAPITVAVDDTLVGDAYDNALMESTIGLFKTELINPGRPWKTLSQVELATAEWIDWYCHRRLHGEIGHVPPVEYETNHYMESTKPQVTTTI
jgi:transposase InsO family protein